MSSEAITRNDLTAILNEVLPPTPSEYRKLLWTNPSPTSSFAAQTISLDLSDYDEVEIYYRRSTANAATFSERYKIGELGLGYYISGTAVGDRTSTISTSGIDVGTAWSSNTAHNDFIIPLFIYGIKYERVLPPTEEYTPPSGFGASTDIASYTAKATAFVAPADGFVWIQCRYTSGNYIGVTVCNADGTNERSVQMVGNGTGNVSTILPIFKGMKAWRSSNNGSNNYLDYVPFI